MPTNQNKINSNEIIIDDSIFEDSIRMNLLIRFLSKHHEKFKENEMYQLHYNRIVMDAKRIEAIEEARGRLLKR